MNTFTKEQQARIEINKQEAYRRKAMLLDSRKKMPQIIHQTNNHHLQQEQVSKNKITDEQRARIEKNRMIALEKRRLREQQQFAIISPQTQPSTTINNQCIPITTNNDNDISSCDEINTVISPPTKRQKTEQQPKPKTFNPHWKLNSANSNSMCNHCNRPMSEHKAYFGNELLMCKFSGLYQCKCKRKWWGAAYMITQNGVFPKYTHPDCKICKSNSKVNVINHKIHDPLEYISRSGGHHERELCPLCKIGQSRLCDRS